ncbi:phosphoribosylaminoimidazolesuccinocarboxamide synthase [Chloroflexota bacterium]
MDTNKSIIMTTELPLPLYSRGKVRDTYDLGNLLLMVATDRISAFDFILPNGIPDKGLVLNQLSAFWLKQTRQIVPNHLIESVENHQQLLPYFADPKDLNDLSFIIGRSMIIKKVKRIEMECVVRGYISGSAWKEYQKSGTVGGMAVPAGLKESQELPEPLFTPTTKADNGHDLPISFEEMKSTVGDELATELKEKSLEIYNYARNYAVSKGIIIADTKMEFGMDNKLILIDELLTPDSSRFWDASQYQIGQSQPSYDKQPVRDWLIQSGWKGKSPVPKLPTEVVAATSKRYCDAFELLTGEQLFREKYID